MKELIKKDDYGVFADMKQTARVDSLFVAEAFEKEHKAVLRAIDAILKDDSGYSQDFNRHNFEPIRYKDVRGRKQRAYAMTFNGFTALVMGFTGARANHFKELYIQRFETIKALFEARETFPELTENIRLAYPDAKPYHYSNECNMINRIVLGKSAKQFRLENEIEAVGSIRPYLTEEQLKMIDCLQRLDAGLLLAVPDYNERKRKLEWYKAKVKEA